MNMTRVIGEIQSRIMDIDRQIQELQELKSSILADTMKSGRRKIEILAIALHENILSKRNRDFEDSWYYEFIDGKHDWNGVKHKEAYQIALDISNDLAEYGPIEDAEDLAHLIKEHIGNALS
jgi:hypothetical protein